MVQAEQQIKVSKKRAENPSLQHPTIKCPAFVPLFFGL
jgi:hypothetical protein